MEHCHVRWGCGSRRREAATIRLAEWSSKRTKLTFTRTHRKARYRNEDRLFYYSKSKEEEEEERETETETEKKWKKEKKRSSSIIHH